MASIKSSFKRKFRPRVRAVLLEAAANKGTRPHLVRALVSRSDDGYRVSVTGSQSSGRLSSFTRGNGLILMPPEASYATGETVEVLLLDREFEMGEAAPRTQVLRMKEPQVAYPQALERCSVQSA